MYEYGNDFYHYNAELATRSALGIIPILKDALPINSVVDFGCGQGAWLRVWQSAGASVLGVDGPYVDRDHLMIDIANFYSVNLAESLELGRSFDLVQSLEVAEHLPITKAEQFVRTLTMHGQCILFSAATPGQGGENHVNEQPLSYWRKIFHKNDYLAVDYVRPMLRGNTTIEQWYRYNIMLYINKKYLPTLPEIVRSYRVPDESDLKDYRPIYYRLRCELIRRLPHGTVNHLARIRAALAAKGRFRGRSETHADR